MRAGTVAAIVGLCGVSAVSRSDAIGPADLMLATATVEAAPIDPSKDSVYVCPMAYRTWVQFSATAW